MSIVEQLETGVLDFSGMDLRSLPDIEGEAGDHLDDLEDLAELGRPQPLAKRQRPQREGN